MPSMRSLRARRRGYDHASRQRLTGSTRGWYHTRRRQQGLRGRRAGGRQRLAGDRRRRVHGPGRPVRVRQDDDPAHGRRARGGHRRRDRDRRSRRDRPGPQGSRHRDGVPELRALPAHDGRAEPRLRAQAAQDAEGRDQAPRRRRRAHPRPRSAAQAQAGGALGRSAAARRDGPRDGARAARLPDGRAALEPRRQAARADARRARPAARPAQDDDRLRHARSGRGDDARRPRRGHARRRPAAVRHAAEPLQAARSTCSWRRSSARPR